METKSYCFNCKKSIDAEYVFEEDRTFFVKKCEVCGEEKTDMGAGKDEFLNWNKAKIVNIPPKIHLTEGSETEDSQCPTHCGTCKNHLQTACCVLIDITERCNQKCPFCFASANEDKIYSDIPLAEIEKKLDFLKEVGEDIPFNIQLSGGEPTVRNDLPEIVYKAKEKGFTYIQINSNGKRLGEDEGYAKLLKDAGTSVIFMQFDGTCDEIYQELRGEKLFETKKKAIENCRKAKLPVTLVPTIVGGVNTENIGEMIDFMIENVDIVKGIHFQPVTYFGRHPQEKKRVSMFEVLKKMEEQKSELKVEDFIPISSGHPLCCFYSIYTKNGDKIELQLSKKNKEEGISCCDTSQSGQTCCDNSKNIFGLEKNKYIKKDRDFVINRWSVSEEEVGVGRRLKNSDEISNIDEFLAFYKENTFTITGMAFQDIDTLDAERLKRCRVQVLSDDNKLVPFCAYNSVYR